MIEGKIDSAIEVKPFTSISQSDSLRKEKNTPVSIFLPAFQGLNIVYTTVLQALAEHFSKVDQNEHMSADLLDKLFTPEILLNRDPRVVLASAVDGLNKKLELRDWRIVNDLSPSARRNAGERGAYFFQRLEPLYAGTNPEVRNLSEEIEAEIIKANGIPTRNILRESARASLRSLRFPDKDVRVSGLKSCLSGKNGRRSDDSQLISYMISEVLPWLCFSRQDMQQETIDIYQAIAFCGIYRKMPSEIIESISGGVLTEEFRQKIIAKSKEQFGISSKIAQAFLIHGVQDTDEEDLQKRITSLQVGQYIQELDKLLALEPDLAPERYSKRRLITKRLAIPEEVISAAAGIRKAILEIQLLQGKDDSQVPISIMTFRALREVLQTCKELLDKKDKSNLFDLAEYFRNLLIEESRKRVPKVNRKK